MDIPRDKLSLQKTLIRFLVCYLIAALIQTLVLAQDIGPHGGPIIFLFWEVPLITVGAFIQHESLTEESARSVIYFVVPLAIALLIAFRCELRRWE